MSAFQYNKRVVPGEINILLITPDVDIREKLAHSLIFCSLRNFKDGPTVRIHGVDSLPYDISSLNIDFIIVLIDTTKKRSKEKVESALHHVDSQFFAKGTCCFLMFNWPRSVYGSDVFLELGKKWKCPTLNCNFSDNDALQETTQKILKLVSIQLGFTPGLRFGAFKNQLKNIAAKKEF